MPSKNHDFYVNVKCCLLGETALVIWLEAGGSWGWGSCWKEEQELNRGQAALSQNTLTERRVLHSNGLGFDVAFVLAINPCALLGGGWGTKFYCFS